MSPKLRRLSAREVTSILQSFGFDVVAQRGSHAKLRRIGPGGPKQVMTAPMHARLDTGTVAGIFKQASRFIPEADLRKHFYTD